MIQQKLAKSGDAYIVTIPKDEVERRGLRDGELVGVSIVSLETRPVLRPELKEVIDRSWAESEETYRYLLEAEDEIKATTKR